MYLLWEEHIQERNLTNVLDMEKIHTEEQPYHSSARKYGAAGIGLLYAVSVTIVLEIPKN